MKILNYEKFISDSILTFNHSYSPGDCLDVNYILKELIQVMRTNNYDVLNHFEEFKPNNLVYLLKL